MLTKFMSVFSSSWVRVGWSLAWLCLLEASMVTRTEEKAAVSPPPLISLPQEVITFVKPMRPKAWQHTVVKQEHR